MSTKVRQSGAWRRVDGVSAATIAALGVYAPTVTTLTCPQLDAASADPVILVPAPGAGKIAQPLAFIVSRTLGPTGGLPGISDGGDFFWGDKSGQAICPVTNTFLTGILDHSDGPPYLDVSAILHVAQLGGGNVYKPYGPINSALTANLPIVWQVNNDPLGMAGALTGSSLHDGGTDYAVNDLFDVVCNGVGNGGVNATGRVTAVSGGVVTAYTLLTAGNQFWPGQFPSTTATTGIGSGLTLNSDVVDSSVNSLTYTIVTIYTIYNK